jgi:hypothetical protein
MFNYIRFLPILIKTGEFILLSIITVIVSPLVALIWVLDMAEKFKQGNRKRLWAQKLRKEFYDNRNNAVIQG